MTTLGRVLDLCCGVGGAGRGYKNAGALEIVGVDLAPQPEYPFQFVRGDALEYLEAHGSEFDFIHSSFPCQAHSALTKGTNQGRMYADLITPGIPMLEKIGRPYVIENVNGAPIRSDVVLCGEMFGLEVIRHRKFQLGGWWTPKPVHKEHRGRVAGWRHGTHYAGPYVAVYGDGGGKGSVLDWRRAMGIHWTYNKKSLAEAIPPAYTEWIGTRFIGSQRESR